MADENLTDNALEENALEENALEDDALEDDDLEESDFELQIVSDSPMTDEELAALTRDLIDDLNEIRGVDAGEVTAPAEEGTRDLGMTLIGLILVSPFGYPTAMRIKRDVKRLRKKWKKNPPDFRHLADVIKRYQQRHQGKHLLVHLSNGTRVEGKNVSERTFIKVVRAVPNQGGVAVIEEQSGVAVIEERKSLD